MLGDIMKYVSGDIWDLAATEDGWVVVPTNTTIRQDGKAVMGAGMAKIAALRDPGLADKLANHIKQWNERIFVSDNVICVPTKRHWREPSMTCLIDQGCQELVELDRILRLVGSCRRIFLPSIGCGLGKLDWERQVRPIVDSILEGDRFVHVTQS